MEKLRVLNSKEKKNLSSQLDEQFGAVLDKEYIVFINPRNRIYIMSKDFSKIDVEELRVNSLGLYFGELNDNSFRLSVDGAQLIGEKATKNILELDDEKASAWMKGEDMELDTDLHGFVIIKNNKDILGCGRISNKKLYNYLPKERRI